MNNDLMFKQFLSGVISLEHLSLRYGAIGNLYQKVFYHKMINKEIGLAGIKLGNKIAHIGSGPYPMTAIQLAHKGFTVDCYDINPDAVSKSLDCIKKYQLDHLVSVFDSSKRDYFFHQYDVIIVSLHIINKNEMLNEVIKTLRHNKTIVYRNPRGILRHFYLKYYPSVTSIDTYKVIKQPFFKESVAYTKI